MLEEQCTGSPNGDDGFPAGTGKTRGAALGWCTYVCRRAFKFNERRRVPRGCNALIGFVLAGSDGFMGGRREFMYHQCCWSSNQALWGDVEVDEGQ
jgi:hypothetical protein